MKRRTFLHAMSTAGLFLAGAGVTERLLHPGWQPLPPATVVKADVFLPLDTYPVFTSLYERLGRLQVLVGHGNFNVLSVDEARRYARLYASVGSFRGEEMAFLEELFAADATEYGFLGRKVTSQLTASVPPDSRVKVGRTGHFLFEGEADRLYQKIRQDVGESLVLTSGIRSVLKQTHLFMGKVRRYRGNLSRASRSIAPPGHSYHSTGDFDVGKAGFGQRNFTGEFAHTAEFHRLVDLGYVDIRYAEKNHDGVHFEPWHIKVV